uniref:Protein O-glucosyltransferase 3 n=1 Tax=Neolamprologus brichardi TaxID=32507 RepID=A0A3Q4G1K4_NEOBR
MEWNKVSVHLSPSLFILCEHSLFLSTSFPVCDSEGISPERCLIWGPGLNPDTVLPVRYFFIQAVDSKGENLTLSPGKDTFKVKIGSLDTNEYLRIHVPPPLDRGDGSFLLRYRLYSTAHKGLKIQVSYKDAAVANSPYTIQGPVHHEYCDCPEPDASVWQSVMQCPADDRQILDDFKSFPTIDLQHLRQEVPHRFSNRGGLIHYAIINNHVYRRTLGKYTDFKMFSDEILLSLTRKVRVPDVEFYINVGDWPLETKTSAAVPILSWCGSTDTRDIVLPTYEVTHSTLETLRGVTNDLLSVQGNTGNFDTPEQNSPQFMSSSLVYFCLCYKLLNFLIEYLSLKEIALKLQLAGLNYVGMYFYTEPTQHADMELVPQLDDHTAACRCERNSYKEETDVKDEL